MAKPDVAATCLTPGGDPANLASMREIPLWFGLVSQRPNVGSKGPDENRLSSSNSGEPHIVVVGCPFEDPEAYRGGAAEGPDAIRAWTRTSEAVDERGRLIEDLRVLDVGNVSASSMEPEVRHASMEAEVRAQVERYPNAMLLTLGGDHGITPAVMAPVAQARRGLALVMLDAHPDTFELYGGERLSHACTVVRAWELDGVDPGSSALVGLRSFAPEELPVLQRAECVISSREWNRTGTGAVADRIAAAVGELPVYLSLDIDVLDPAFAPGTGYPVPGGPSTRMVLELLERLWGRHEIVAMDIVEVAPPLDLAGITTAAAAQVILQIFGWIARRVTRHC